MKHVRKLPVLIVLIGVIALSGCDLFGPEIPGPGAPTVTAGHDELLVSWTVFDGASEYVLYHRDETGNNGTVEVYRGTTTSYTDTDLDSSLKYEYALRAVTSEGTTELGEFSPLVQPEPTITLNVTFSSYANEDAGYRL